jgi:hypothetical protein
VARAALLVADLVEREQHLLAEARAFAQHRLDDVAAGILEAGQVAVPLQPSTASRTKRVSRSGAE